MLGASFRLGDSTVFRNTNWQFLKQQHWAVLGPNGSGKSLFADALCGSLPLIAGELNYHFRPPAGYSHEEAIAKVTFDDRKAQNHDTVVQSRWTSFEQESSSIVREFLSYDRVMEVNPFEVTTRHESLRRSFGRRQQRVSRLLELASLMHKTLLALSNGERQRVELARALCRPLRLLILDDPMTGLDAANRVAFARVLNWIMRGSTRVLYITHRAEDLPAAITHELWIGDCQVKEAGSRRTTPGNLRKRTRARGLKPKLIASTARASNSEPALLKFKSVTVRYGAATLLDGLNWTVQQGESWALLGANGSGKSTDKAGKSRGISKDRIQNVRDPGRARRQRPDPVRRPAAVGAAIFGVRRACSRKTGPPLPAAGAGRTGPSRTRRF